MKMAYENKYDWTLGENKPNQTQFQMPANPSKEREDKKGIRNFFLVSIAGKDILYGKSWFSSKFGESSFFDCL
jgi:hypothetical protein